MSKKFVVRLRKGGVAGNIVANSQVITIDPLTAGKIYPSNFADGRLAGRIVTSGRSANFIKGIIPKPTTTTTTTTRGPNQTTTTTTLSPSAPRPSTTTTTTSAKVSTNANYFEIKSISPQKVSAGSAISVTVYYENIASATTMWLGIIQGTGDGVVADGIYRPDINSIASPSFKLTAMPNTIATQINIPQTAQGSQTVKVTFKKPLTWLLKDFQEWNFCLLKPLQANPAEPGDIEVIWGNKDLAKRPILTPPATPITLSVVMNNPTSSDQGIVYPGETVYINLDGLTVGSKYAVVLRHWWEWADNFGGPPVLSTRTFTKSWFNTSYLTSAGSDGWIIGGTFSGNRYPAKMAISKLETNTVTAYYYPFGATTAAKTISLPVASGLKVNYTNTKDTDVFRVTDDRFKAAQVYKFECMLMDFDGVNMVDVNYGAQIGPITSVNNFAIRDSRPLFQINLDDPTKTKLTAVDRFRIWVRTDRAFDSTNLGTSGIRLVVSFFGENNNVTSNSFKFYGGYKSNPTAILATNPNFPGNQNFYVDITAQELAWTAANGNERVIDFELNSAGVYRSGGFGFVMYAYRIQDQPSPIGTWFSNDYIKIAEYRNYFTIEGGAETLSVANPIFSPANGILNETPDNNVLFISFDITASSVRTIYWRAEGPNITADDFDGGNSGNFDTVAGTLNVKNAQLKVKADAATEGDEVFSIKLYTSNSLTALPFYTFPTQVTIRDTSISIDEQVKKADSEVAPFYNNVPIAFVVTSGVRNSQFDIIANGNILMSPFLGDDGSWTGYCDFTGTPPGALTITFKFKATEHIRTVEITFVGNKGATPPSGGIGGREAGCPDPNELINISPDSYVRAGNLQVGDLIWTMHEHTLEYGYFSVASVEEIKQPKLKISFSNDRDVTVSLTHRFLTDDNQYVWARDLREGSWVQAKDGRVQVIKLAKANVGPVVKLEIDRAHTYIVNGFISHNVKSVIER